MSYRPNVAAIVRRRDGKILVCERRDVRGAWQFPQGGIFPDETAEQALVRELREEISLEPEDFVVVFRKGPYRYDFKRGRRKEGYVGQEQEYFLVNLVGPESHINVQTPHPEFCRTQWIEPHEFEPSWLIATKEAVYRQVLSDFFEVELPERH